MDEESFSRPHAHPRHAATRTRALGIPGQRSPNTPDAAHASQLPSRPVMGLARVTLAVIFSMLLVGMVMSVILSRA
jgi:hypothetical protein